MTDETKSANEPPLDCLVMPLPLKERLRLAQEFTKLYGGRGDSLRPYQRFSLTIGELLDAAIRGA